MEQAPGFYRRRIGDAVVTALNDGMLTPPLEILVGVAPENAAALLQAAGRPPRLALSVNAFLVQTPGQTILIDTGAADRMGPTLDRLLPNLTAAGTHPDEIDFILLTHIHGDHSGGLTTADGTVLYPRAQLRAAQAELEYWLDDAQMSAAPDIRKNSFSSARASLAPYSARTPRARPGRDPRHHRRPPSRPYARAHRISHRRRPRRPPYLGRYRPCARPSDFSSRYRRRV